MEIIRLSIGMILLIVVNILLGSINALFTKSFSREKLIEGMLKAMVFIVCIFVTYYVGWLNPNIASITINGMKVDVLTALHMAMLAGYGHYAKQVIEKVFILLKPKDDHSDDRI